MRYILPMFRALHLVWRSGPGWALANAALAVVQGLLPLAALYLVKLVTDAVAAGVTAPDKAAALAQVTTWVAAAAAVALAAAGCRAAAGVVSEAQAQVVTDRVYDVLHAKSVEVDLGYYESSQYHDKLYRAQHDAPFRPTRILNSTVQFVQGGVGLLSILGLLLTFHWVFAAALFAAAAPGVVARLRTANRTYRWQRGRTEAERKAMYLNWVLTDARHAKEVRLLNLGALLMDRFRTLREQLRRERLALTLRRSGAEFLAQAGGTLVVFGSYGLLAQQAVEGTISLGDLVMYLQAFQRGQGLVLETLSSLSRLYEDNLFLADLYEFLDVKGDVVRPVNPRPVPRPLRIGITLDHVSFRYPDGGRKVLDDVTLAIRPGETVALVGENGSGKTTLVKLLCRLYDPCEGSVRLDGIDVRQFDPAELRREVGVLLQDYVQYNLPARENIWFGDVRLPPDSARIPAAARHAGVDEVVNGLPAGYDTVLGKVFEDGEELSIGQWQRLALARTFVGDAQILILDEPTSALDAKAEGEVFRRFRELAKGRTALFISHRFSTVRMADRIFLLEGGRITESGSHEELICMGGSYARLFKTQAQYYV